MSDHYPLPTTHYPLPTCHPSLITHCSTQSKHRNIIKLRGARDMRVDTRFDAIEQRGSCRISSLEHLLESLCAKELFRGRPRVSYPISITEERIARFKLRVPDLKI